MRVTFAEKIFEHKLNLKRSQLTTLQVNIGKRCNQACLHCHVESTPLRTENMEAPTVEKLLELIRNTPSLKTVDITGGAPEMNPNFRHFVTEIRKMGIQVIDRCNLTIFFEPGQQDTPQFLKDQGVTVIASLPCYSKDNVEKQRGRGVFGKSIEALQMLNKLGFGVPGTGLTLDLVYNPLGPSLPPAQAKLETDYKKELQELFGIQFNRLYTITNMPIKRFLTDLNRQGKLESYMELLANSFNPHAAEGIMCKSLVSISWDGKVYDCDFNQMLEMETEFKGKSIWDLNSFSELQDGSIRVADHCYACTAGAGSSCSGTLTNN